MPLTRPLALPRRRRIGGLASATIGVLLRSLVGLEDGGGNELFGEPQFQISDLLRTAPMGAGSSRASSAHVDARGAIR